LLNPIKSEDDIYTEKEHAVNTAWTTWRGAWGIGPLRKVLEHMGHLAEISSIKRSEVRGRGTSELLTVCAW
jgi:NADH:ubiquinone oxidoreductase subunit F (NADH-binding)